MAGMTLVVVRCPTCGNALAPGDDDLVIACAQCGAGLQLADEGPEPIDIQYARTGLAKAATWRPWWVFQGSVNLINRETQGGNRSDEARRFWAQPRVMCVPAWDLSLATVKQAGVQMLKQPPVPLTESLILRHLANRHYETKTSYPEHPETDPQYLESEAPEHTSLEVNAPKGCSFSG